MKMYKPETLKNMFGAKNERMCFDGKAFYGTRISENISRTPEGFLICRNVPIAKVGTQDYLGSELGIDDYPNKVFKVIREEKEVFDPASIASFEGKPFTDEHPQSGVNAENYVSYSKGHATNVRRGTGSDKDKLIADIIIYDKIAAEQVENGKREISCGYNCQFVTSDDGKIYQRKIRGNHVALVDDGRAGGNVSIRDKNTVTSSRAEDYINKNSKKGANKTMSKASKTQMLVAKIIQTFAVDAEPEELAEAIELLTKDPDEASEVAKVIIAENEKKKDGADDNSAKTNDEGDDPMAELLKEIKCLRDEVSEMKKGYSKDEDPLEKLEKAIEASESEDAADEEDVTLSVAEVEESEEDLEDEAYETEELETVTEIADKKAVLQMIKTMKPIVAAMKDEKQKKAVTDSMYKLAAPLLNSNKPKNPKGQNTYDAIQRAKSAAAQRSINDAKRQGAKTTESNGRGLGENIAKSRNPHYMKKD